MATQHPDNAGVPWWKKDGSAFVSTQDEIDELLIMYRDLPIDEYMWDWEGKYVDEAVGEKFYSQGRELLAKKVLGQDIHLTYRIPAFDEEKLHRMARAFMNLLSLNDLATDIGVATPPVREMFLPLTTSADQLLKVRSAFTDVATYHRQIFGGSGKKHDDLLRELMVTPLVEDASSMFDIDAILRPYWETLVKEKVDLKTFGRRVFLARSDPALNAGLVPAVLAIKVALSKADSLGKELGFQVHPIIGTGSLPFRGSVNPLYADTFLEQYSGVRTYSIQSAFRYDYEHGAVAETLRRIKKEAPERDVVPVSQADAIALRELADRFASLWKPVIEALAPLINQVAGYVPPRRERMQHTGLFGYSRGIGGVKLPRAIGFTAALYSIGVPPELIATGLGLKFAKDNGKTDLLERFYPALRADLEHAGKYLNRENLKAAAQQNSAFAEVLEGLPYIEEYIGKELGPYKSHHLIHRNLTSTIYQRLQGDDIEAALITDDIVEAGKIRRSLG